MGHSMLEAPKLHTVRRTQRQRQDDEITIDGRSTSLDGSTQHRDTYPTPTRPMETETPEESNKFNHCVMAGTTRQRIQREGVTNILMSLGQSEELKQANISFLAKILRAKCTTIQDGQTYDGTHDLAERNKKLSD